MKPKEIPCWLYIDTTPFDHTVLTFSHCTPWASLTRWNLNPYLHNRGWLYEIH